MLTTFAKNLNRYASETGKTRKEMSVDLGIPYTTIADWFNGNRVPKMDKVQKVAEYFGCTISDLLEEHKAEPETDREVMIAYEMADEHTKAMVRRLLAYQRGFKK